MLRPNLLATSISTNCPAAEKGAPGGGGGGHKDQLTHGTLKERLTAALAKVTDLEGDKTKLSDELDEEKEKVTKLDGEKAKLAADLKTANERVTALTGEKTELQTKLTAAEGKVTKLEGEAKTADERASEKAAANGIVATPTDPDRVAAQGTDGAALYAEYSKLKGRERTAFFKANEKALMAYGKELEKAG